MVMMELGMEITASNSTLGAWDEQLGSRSCEKQAD